MSCEGERWSKHRHSNSSSRLIMQVLGTGVVWFLYLRNSVFATGRQDVETIDLQLRVTIRSLYLFSIQLIELLISSSFQLFEDIDVNLYPRIRALISFSGKLTSVLAALTFNTSVSWMFWYFCRCACTFEMSFANSKIFATGSSVLLFKPKLRDRPVTFLPAQQQLEGHDFKSQDFDTVFAIPVHCSSVIFAGLFKKHFKVFLHKQHFISHVILYHWANCPLNCLIVAYPQVKCLRTDYFRVLVISPQRAVLVYSGHPSSVSFCPESIRGKLIYSETWLTRTAPWSTSWETYHVLKSFS